jgi:type II secretory pathway pseudopilin PulG
VREYRGFALVAVMMILAILSVLGVAGIQSAVVETQISARDRDARQALFVAQSALEEARSTAARGWGRIEVVSTGTVRVATPSPPGLSWSAERYRGFTLVDQNGASFTVTTHTADANPTLHVTPGTPAAGSFVLLRSDFSGAWNGSRLVVVDDAWALASSAVSSPWAGWLLWNAAGEAKVVSASTTNFPVGLPAEVRLALSSDPGPGPYVLSQNPWLRALASGTSCLPGDQDAPGTPECWNRDFSADATLLGSAWVTTRWLTASSSYRLTSVATAGLSRGEVSLRVHRAGRADQQARDWAIR